MSRPFGFQPDRLHCWLFGPGTGELAVVYVPPKQWLVVDGCQHAGSSWAVRFFEELRAADQRLRRVAPTHLLLSHPHLDHAGGVAELIDWCTSQNHRPKLAAIPRPSNRSATLDDPMEFVASGQAQGALNAIGKWWKSDPSTRWEIHVGVRRRFGAGELTFLSPEPGTVASARAHARAGRSIDWNELASAVLITWKKTRVLLGSDLVNKCWAAAAARLPAGPVHVLKVAHHGSREAQHHDVLGRLEKVSSVLCTPFARQDLPSFDDDEGADLLLRRTRWLELTGLPHKVGQQAGVARTLARADLLAEPHGFICDDPKDFPSSWVKVVADGNGRRSVTRGPGSVRVVEQL